MVCVCKWVPWINKPINNVHYLRLHLNTLKDLNASLCLYVDVSQLGVGSNSKSSAPHLNHVGLKLAVHIKVKWNHSIRYSIFRLSAVWTKDSLWHNIENSVKLSSPLTQPLSLNLRTWHEVIRMSQWSSTSPTHSKCIHLFTWLCDTSVLNESSGLSGTSFTFWFYF